MRKNKMVSPVFSSALRGMVLVLSASMLAGCFSPSKPPEPLAQPLPVVDPNPFGPVVGEDGRCKGSPSIDLANLKSRNSDAALVGVSECELVALKGEATGKAVYLFANNQMVRVVRGNAQ